MAEQLEIRVKVGNPDFLDLPWHAPLLEWESDQFVDLPRGVSRHPVRFIRYSQSIYAIKELPRRGAQTEYRVLRSLDRIGAPAVRPAAVVVGRADHQAPHGAALITHFESFAFPYRHLISGAGLGPRRTQLLEAFARLLVQLHLAGCYWGDCSLSNVLYRWDAEAIQPVMVDAETSHIHEELSEGQREEDLEIMVVNVAGGMADIAADRGSSLDDADLEFGSDVANRYRRLWAELTEVEDLPAGSRHQIAERVQRLNELGFDIDELTLRPTEQGQRVSLRVRIGGRAFHARRLKDWTGIDALEAQARQILTDVQLWMLDKGHTPGEPGTGALASHWRTEEFDPAIERLKAEEGVLDPVQAYCDLLHYVFDLKASARRHPSEMMDDWLEAGRPGYPIPG